MTNCTHLQQ